LPQLLALAARLRESVPETRHTEDTEHAGSVPSLNDSPDQAAMRPESISLIKTAIDKLPHDLKTAILLYEYQSLSYGEISAVLGCSTKAVETKLYRARKFLRKRLLRSDLR
jgi:RNA polymerase sigma factor (sigma-70 family)